jgi:tryptophan 2,3-dioxygenase
MMPYRRLRVQVLISRLLLARDWSKPHVFSPEVEAAFLQVYRNQPILGSYASLPRSWWTLTMRWPAWRHKHVLTVEPSSVEETGTGGTSGVTHYLSSTVGKRAFPELWSLRTQL